MQLASAFYENDFPWEEIKEERLKEWEERPVTTIAPSTKDGNIWNRLFEERGGLVYKPRRYILKAFPDLLRSLNDQEGVINVLDLGCGAGASLLPILFHRSKNLNVKATDISKEALMLLSSSIQAKIREPSLTFEASTWDLTQPLQNTSLQTFGDFAILIFTLSAIPPEKHLICLKNVVNCLKPGGSLLFRDYGWLPVLLYRFNSLLTIFSGAFDLVQVRCKKKIGAWTIQKEDGVLCTFFTIPYLTSLFEQAGLAFIDPPRYCTIMNINRKSKQQMKRVFIHCVAIPLRIADSNS